MSNSTGGTKATCVTRGDWSFNSLGQSPCDIAAALGGVCTGGQFTLYALPPGYYYLGPSVANVNTCRCSTVYYSLLSACSNCQGRDFLMWSAYNGNCTTVSVSTFPEPIPAGTLVPHYAYLDVLTTDQFNITLAQSAGGAESSPVSTPSATYSYSPTQTGTKAKSSSNVGPIAGGVIGGLIFLALLAGFIFWLIRHNRNKAPPPSQMYHGPDTSSSPPPMGFSGTNPYTTTPPKLYDPSDPSTYPTNQTPPTSYSPSYGNVTPNYTGASQNTAVGYPGRFTGAAEVT